MVLPGQAVPTAEMVLIGLIQVTVPVFDVVTVGLQLSIANVVDPLAVQPFPLCVTTTK